MKINGLLICLLSFLIGCASVEYKKTVNKVELERFMGQWYVQGGRFTYFEKGACNAVETYTYDASTEEIKIEFSYNQDTPKGDKKSIPQKGWVKNKQTNAFWKVSPFWPLKFDYLIIDLADDYSWTAIGVPNQKYLWIMSREVNLTDAKMAEIYERLNVLGYDIQNTVRVLQQW